MFRLRLAVILLILFVLSLGGGAWWYLFGPNLVSAAELVPGDTLFFATIPNAAEIAAGYQGSQLKELCSTRYAKAALKTATEHFGERNMALIEALLPSLSGQSLIALTNLQKDGTFHLILAMRPKPGLDRFDDFIEQLKATYPDIWQQGTPGNGTIGDIPYRSIQGPGASDKICVAKYKGWILTGWGEASLRDFIERLDKKSTSPSLAQSITYQNSLQRIGPHPLAMVYLNFPAITLPASLQKTSWNETLAQLGPVAIGTQFEKGEIVDRYAMLAAPEALARLGADSGPCDFETLKFTGPDTRFYWASSIDWQHLEGRLQSETGAPTNPLMTSLAEALQSWTQAANLDWSHNIFDALGSEISVQVEWPQDRLLPDIGFLVKVDKPDQFKPTAQALVETFRRIYGPSAISETTSHGQTFATAALKISLPLSPTIAEDGPYFGLFLTKDQALQIFTRDGANGLTQNADFNRQIGSRRDKAFEMGFLDSPALLNHAYRTAVPYLSLAAMFNRQVGALLKGRELPKDLEWLDPMGTWSFVGTTDPAGITFYSVSGVGNQGILGMAALAAGGNALRGVGASAPQRPDPFKKTFIPAPAAAAIPTPTLTPPASSPAPISPPAGGDASNDTPEAATNAAPDSNLNVQPAAPTPP